MIDQFFGLDFDCETKCVEDEKEEVIKSREHFLQYNCYIDKEVKYLHSGLKNVSLPDIKVQELIHEADRSPGR